MRCRLVVAAVLYVPLSSLSILVSLFPEYRFADWQWMLIALAAPVVVWAAWPFHRAALRNVRHGRLSADSLISLGVVAACGWSVYAMFALDGRPAPSSAFYGLKHASGGGIYLVVAASVTTFSLAGRFYEARARRTTGAAGREAGKAEGQRIADRICGVFVPSMLVLACATLAGWLVAGGPAGRAFSAALAVLIAACPCALGLATPAALMVASRRGADLGIFIRGFRALESSRLPDTVVLDKTGTVTTGIITVLAVYIAPGVSRADLLVRAGSVEQASEHPVAVAVSALARSTAGSLPSAEGYENLPGLGARSVVDGCEVLVGRPRLMAERGLAVPSDLASVTAEWERLGRAVILAGWDGQVRGAFAVGDTVKPTAASAVAELRELGLSTVLLSGDATAATRAVAAATGIDEVAAEALPDAKIAFITGLRAQGRPVAMVGHGADDGPALAAADLSLVAGADSATSAADMILMRDDIGAVPEAVRLARATTRTIRQNLGWAFGYNLAAIPLAAAGFCDPLVVTAAMALSSAFVVGNSVRLRRFGAVPSSWRTRLGWITVTGRGGDATIYAMVDDTAG